MLVLTLKKNAKVFLTHPDGTEAEVVFLSNSRDGGIRLGFTAPKEINILREKVRLRNQAKQLAGKELQGTVVSHQKKETTEAEAPATSENVVAG